MNKCGVLVSIQVLFSSFKCGVPSEPSATGSVVIVDTKETVRLGLLKMKLHV